MAYEYKLILTEKNFRYAGDHSGERAKAENEAAIAAGLDVDVNKNQFFDVHDLNALGADGWRLTLFTHSESSNKLGWIFMREVP